MADVRTVGKQLVFDFTENARKRARLLRQRLAEELIYGSRLGVRKYSLLFYVLKIAGEQVHDAMPAVTEFLWIHFWSPEAIL